jgi:hypothetical protein
VRDLQAQLEDARKDLSRAEANWQYWETRVGEIMAAAAPPAEPSDDPLAHANRVGHAAYLQANRAAMAAMGTPQRARRPKGHGGLAARSEVTCEECIKVGATPTESWLIHNDPCPIDAPEIPDDDEVEWLKNHRSEAGRYQPVRAGATITRRTDNAIVTVR